MVDYMLEDTALTPKMMVRSIAILIGSITPVFVLYAPKFMEIYRNKMNDSKYTTDSGKSGSATHGRTHTNIVADRSRAHDPIAKINPPHLRFDLRSEVGPSPHSKKSDVDSTLGQGTNMSRRESILNDSGVGTSDLIDDIVFVPDSEMAELPGAHGGCRSERRLKRGGQIDVRRHPSRASSRAKLAQLSRSSQLRPSSIIHVVHDHSSGDLPKLPKVGASRTTSADLAQLPKVGASRATSAPRSPMSKTKAIRTSSAPRTTVGRPVLEASQSPMVSGRSLQSDQSPRASGRKSYKALAHAGTLTHTPAGHMPSLTALDDTEDDNIYTA
eukprot:g54728.t1